MISLSVRISFLLRSHIGKHKPVLTILLMSFVCFTTAYAKIVKHKASDGKTIIMDISSKDLNRVFVKGLRLHKLRAVKNTLVLKKDDKKGQYYIMPYDRDRKRPINFFLQDEAGNVYTVIARPKDIPPQTHMIMPVSIKSLPVVSAVKSTDYHKTISDLMMHLHLRSVPQGYIGTNEIRKVMLWKETDFKQIRRLVGRRYIGETYIAKNIDTKPMTLHEKEFADNARQRNLDVKGVAVERRRLLPGEQTLVHIVSRRK